MSDDDPLAALPARLRTLREHLGHDVRTFAKLVNLSPRTIRAHEAGTAGKIRTGTMMAICETTGCSIDWLITGSLGCDEPRDDSTPKFRGGRPVTKRAAEWIQQADRAGLDPSAVLDGETRWLLCNMLDVDHDLRPMPADGELGTEVVDALIARGRFGVAPTA